MSAVSEYLHAAKVEEVATRLRSQGYDVRIEPQGAFDILATKGQRRLAVEVKLTSSLGTDPSKVMDLRDRASQEGYDFELVVVPPTEKPTIEVERLAEALRGYLADHPPANLTALGDAVVIDRVASVEITEVRVRRGSILVAGVGAIFATVRDLRDRPQEWTDGFPLSFSVTLTPELEVSEVHQISVDTSEIEAEA